MLYPWMNRDNFSSGNGGVFFGVWGIPTFDEWNRFLLPEILFGPPNKNYISFSFFPVILRPSDGYKRRDKLWH